MNVRPKDDIVHRETKAFWSAVEGHSVKDVHNLLGSYRTEDDARKIMYRANYHKILRDKLLGSVWHTLGKSIQAIVDIKKLITKEE